MPKQTQRLLSDQEKEEILKLHSTGVQQKDIARKLKRATSTINTFICHGMEDRTKAEKEMELSSLPNTVLFRHERYYTF